MNTQPEEANEMSQYGNCPGCGKPVNANGNCFTDTCWNDNSKRHDGQN